MPLLPRVPTSRLSASSRLSAFVALLVLVGGAGCPDDEPVGGGGSGGSGGGGSPFQCPYDYNGDPAAPMEIEVFYLGADDKNHDVTDGAVLDMIEPPQGGRVIFVGVRAKNVSPCGVSISAGLRDPINNKVNFESRSVNLVPDGSGFAVSRLGEVASYANTPTCFNTWSAQNLFDGDYTLEVTVEDNDGHKAEKTFAVTATCSDKSLAGNSGQAVIDQCMCICKTGYMLGEDCAAGGGGTGGAGGGA